MEEYNILNFGYTEMYEWNVIPDEDKKFCRFVTFNKGTNKIEYYGKSETDYLLGVTTITALATSDNPQEWTGKYQINEFGDILLTSEKLAVGTKQYDEDLELSYIRTYPWEHYIRILSDNFNPEVNYVPRDRRQEWVRVNLIGKTFVVDNNTCKPGDLCKPYVGDDESLYGTAVPAKSTDKNTFYVLERISDSVVMIVNK